MRDLYSHYKIQQNPHSKEKFSACIIVSIVFKTCRLLVWLVLSCVRGLHDNPFCWIADRREMDICNQVAALAYFTETFAALILQMHNLN